MLLKYFFAWFGMMVLAIINGGLRDLAYKPHVGDLPAHQISTAILILLLAGRKGQTQAGIELKII